MQRAEYKQECEIHSCNYESQLYLLIKVTGNPIGGRYLAVYPHQKTPRILKISPKKNIKLQNQTPNLLVSYFTADRLHDPYGQNLFFRS